jgi:hypothetical protein
MKEKMAFSILLTFELRISGVSEIVIGVLSLKAMFCLSGSF